jgi:NAD(P)-dependent dehydrogenase (short-subunit alcohol dehydrogenase family)
MSGIPTLGCQCEQGIGAVAQQRFAKRGIACVVPGRVNAASITQNLEALIGFRGDGGTSHDQSCDESTQESFAPAPDVVHELEEAEIQRQLLLRDAPVWSQPGA